MTRKPACLLMAAAMCLGQIAASWAVTAQEQTQTKAPPTAPPPPTKPGEQDQVLKVNTELVEVRAVVMDKQGKIVSGLKQEDFELLENGKPQEVTFFSIAGHDNRPQTAADNSSTGKTDAPQTSRQRLRDTPARSVVLFVDNLHLSVSSLLLVKQALRHFIDEQLTDEDLIALVCSTGTTGLVEQFTRNRQVLHYAIERINPGLAATQETLFTPYLAAQVAHHDSDATAVAIEILKQEGTVDGNLPASMLADFARGRANGVIVNALYQRRAMLLTLKAVAERMAGMPGQRIITLFSDGFTLYDDLGSIDTSELQAVVSRAGRSGVAIYSIDARGLQAPAFVNASIGNALPDTRILSYQSAAERDLESGLNALAKDTGGEAFFHTNDLSGALRKVLDINRMCYVLAYYPLDERKNKQFRRLTIRVKNHPEYIVHSTKGYLPMDVAKAKQEETDATPEQRLMRAMLTPLARNDITISASADFLEGEADEAQVTLRVTIAGDKLDYPKQDQKRSLGLELVMLIYDESGQRVDGKSVTVQGSIKPENILLVKQNGYNYVRRVALKPGVYQARIGVREINTEHIGTATAWVDVPNLSKTKLALSSLLLLDAPINTSPASPGTQNSTPFAVPLVEGIRFYSNGQPLMYFFRIYHTAQSSIKGLTMQTASLEGLVMQTEFIQDGKMLRQSEWQPVSERQLGTDKRGIGVGSQIQLAGLKPGIYEMRVTVKDPATKHTAVRTVAFGIE